MNEKDGLIDALELQRAVNHASGDIDGGGDGDFMDFPFLAETNFNVSP